MYESIHKYMKVGIIQPMLYPTAYFRAEDSLREILQDEFWDAVEVPPMGDAPTRTRMRRMIDTAGVVTSYVGPPRLFGTGQNLNHLDKTQRMKAVENIKQGIDEAYDYGSQDISIVSGQFEQSTKSESYKALAESVSALCAYAKANGDLKIALEIFDHDVDKCVLIGPAREAAAFAKEISAAYDNFGLLLDHGHLPLTRESPVEAVTAVKEHLIHAHIGNNLRCDLPRDTPSFGDHHPRFGFPGGAIGEAELADFLGQLLKIGFLNPQCPPIVSFEVKPQGAGTMHGYEDSSLVAANVKRMLRRAWALV